MKYTKVYDNGIYEEGEKNNVGNRHGKIKQWFTVHGTLRSKLHYHEGNPHGECITYYPSGNIHYKDIYNHGKLCHRKVYDPQSKLIMDIPFRNGVMHGTVTLKYTDDTIDHLTFVHGKREGQRVLSTLHDNTKIHFQYKHDTMNGPVSFYDNDKCMYTLMYSNGNVTRAVFHD